MDVHDHVVVLAKATKQGFFRFVLCGVGTTNCSFVWPDPGAACKAALLFLLACRKGDIAIHRDVARLIATNVRNSRYEMRKEGVATADANAAQIVVLECGRANLGFQQFVSALPQNECRFALVRVDAEPGFTSVTKLMVLVWTPDGAKIRQKMIYSGAKIFFSKCVRAAIVDFEIRASELEEIDYMAVMEKASHC